MARELFATTDTGIGLYWLSYEPTSGTSWPAVVVLHVGGYKTGNPGPANACNALAQAGFWAVGAEYRLAPPHLPMNVTGGHETPGQDTVSDDGLFPKQTDDVADAIQAARADPRCNGSVYVVGGSAGGSHAAYMLATGTPGDDQPDLAVILSCGVSNLGDPNMLALADVSGETSPHGACTNYVGISPDPWPTYTSGQLATLTAASPVTYMTGVMPPMFVMMASMDSLGIPTSTGIEGQSDLGPPETAVENGLIPKLLDVGMTESSLDVPETGKFKKYVVPVTSHKHAFEYWNSPYNGTGGLTVGEKIIAWLQGAPVVGPPPPPSGDGTIPTGAAVLPSGGNPVPDALLADPNVDIVVTGAPWNVIEPTEGNYDFSSILSEIQRIAAAGKKVELRIPHEGGSETFGGATPNWVFDAIGAAPGGDLRTFTDAVTNSTPTVTSATAQWHTGDLFMPISGDNIPSDTFIGLINSVTSIELSSSDTVNTPVSATGSGSGGTIVMSERPVVSGTTHAVVPAKTYDFLDPNPNHQGDPQTTIPVFYEPTFMAKRVRMWNELGNYLLWQDNLTQLEMDSIGIVVVGYANSQTEDWSFPHSNTVDPGYTQTQVDQWLNPSTSAVSTAINFGCDYTSQKLVDAAIKRANETLTDVQTFSNTRMVSATGNFTYADVGKFVSASGIITPGTTISAWVSHTEVTLSAATLTTASSQSVSIAARDTGVYDIAAAAFPFSAISNAIGPNGTVVDAAAAAADGDTDVNFYMVRTVNNLARGKYPGRIIAQINSIKNTIATADVVETTNRLHFLIEVAQNGGYVAGQNAWYCYQDASYRMNGGSADDPDNPGTNLTDLEILIHTIAKFGTYNPLYLEIYGRDAQYLPEGIAYAHDALHRTDIEPPPPPPPPDPYPVPGSALPPALYITGVNYRDEVLYQTADLLNIDVDRDLTPVRSRRWSNSHSRHVRYAWRLYKWPELILTEERAFASIWNVTTAWSQSKLVYYLGIYDEDNVLMDNGYYISRQPVPAGTLPTDTTYFLPYTLTDRDYYIAIQQGCRQKLGDVYGVFPTDPSLGELNYAPISLNWRKSNRGIEVLNWSVGETVFIRYRVNPYQYSSTIWDNATSYSAGTLVMYSDGEVYRAISNVAGVIPPTHIDKWAHVPFPAVFAQYAAYMAAADDSDDMEAAKDFRDLAMDFLTREIDSEWIQGTTTTYNFGNYSNTVPCGTNWYALSTAATSTITTISDKCLDEWGSILPT